MTTTPTTGTVTDEQAHLLYMHARYVQGGYSTPDIERERAEKDIAAGAVINWAKMEAEVNDAVRTRLRELPATPAPAPAAPTIKVNETPVDVTAVLADITIAEALRDDIKKRQADLKKHEDAIKDVLAGSTVGVDSEGKVRVRQPVRNRTDLIKDLVKSKMSDVDYAECERVSSYRILQYGE